MVRFDFSSAAVIALAVASSLSAAFWLNHLGHNGEARAAPAYVAVAPSASGDAAQVVRAADGHYWAQANIDGHAIRVLVDTGASVVALTRDDALRLGLTLTPEDFSTTVTTASGPARAAAVELASVSVAGARVGRVSALVVESGLPNSLLGMSYLGRLSGFQATPEALTLLP
jgi:aspartyl protease family protein